MEVNTSATASSGATEAKRWSFARVLNNGFVRSGEAGSRPPFPACKLRRRDSAQGARYIQGTEKSVLTPDVSGLVFRCAPRQPRDWETGEIRRRAVPDRCSSGAATLGCPLLRSQDCAGQPRAAALPSHIRSE